MTDTISTNVSSSGSEHGTPSEGAACACCWDDLGQETYVEYKTSETSAWLPSGFCINCVNHLLDTQWDVYVNALAKTTCKAEQRRLLAKGPPINLKDTKALPCPDDGEVHSLWFMVDNTERSAKLRGSLVGEVSEAVWYHALSTMLIQSALCMETI